jgi:hypothetical protein
MKYLLFVLIIHCISFGFTRFIANGDVDPPVSYPIDGETLDRKFNLKVKKALNDSVVRHLYYLNPVHIERVQVHFNQTPNAFDGREFPVIAVYRDVKVMGFSKMEVDNRLKIKLQKTKFNNILMTFVLYIEGYEIESNGLVSYLGFGSAFTSKGSVGSTLIEVTLHFSPDSLIHVQHLTIYHNGMKFFISDPLNGVNATRLRDESVEPINKAVMEEIQSALKRVLVNLDLDDLDKTFRDFLSA